MIYICIFLFGALVETPSHLEHTFKSIRRLREGEYLYSIDYLIMIMLDDESDIITRRYECGALLAEYPCIGHGMD